MPDLAALTAKDLRALPLGEIRDNIGALKREQFNLRFQQATGQLEKISRIRQVRQAIARHLTIVNETRNDPHGSGGAPRRDGQIAAGTTTKSTSRKKRKRNGTGTQSRAAWLQGFVKQSEAPSAGLSPNLGIGSVLWSVLETGRQVEANLAGSLQNARASLATSTDRSERLEAADELHLSLTHLYKTAEGVENREEVATAVEDLSDDIVDLVLDDDACVGRASALLFASLLLGPDDDLARAVPSAAAWPAAVNGKVKTALETLVRDHPIKLLTEYRVDAVHRRSRGLRVDVILRVLDHLPFKVGDEYISVVTPNWLTDEAPLRVDAEIDNDGVDTETKIGVERVRINGEIAACLVKVHTQAPDTAELVLRPVLDGHRLETRRYVLGDLETADDERPLRRATA